MPEHPNWETITVRKSTRKDFDKIPGNTQDQKLNRLLNEYDADE